MWNTHGSTQNTLRMLCITVMLRTSASVSANQPLACMRA